MLLEAFEVASNLIMRQWAFSLLEKHKETRMKAEETRQKSPTEYYPYRDFSLVFYALV